MKEKRFQECSILEKLWRLRWYLALPLIWFYYQFVKPFNVGQDELIDGKIMHTDKFDRARGVLLWKLLVGNIQSKMRWYYTYEEFLEILKNK